MSLYTNSDGQSFTSIEAMLAHFRQTRKWWQPGWWAVQRWWEWLMNIPNEIVYFYHRGTRGWADSDVWSIDCFLAEILPPMLKRLKVTKHGMPTEMFDLDPTNDHGGIKDDDEGWKVATARWEAVLDDLIFTFEAAQKIQRLEWLLCDDLANYEQFVAKWDKKLSDTHLMTREECERYARGWQAFQEHFFDLWD